MAGTRRNQVEYRLSFYPFLVKINLLDSTVYASFSTTESGAVAMTVVTIMCDFAHAT